MSEAETFFRRAESLLERLERLLPAEVRNGEEDGVAWRWRKANGIGNLHVITRLNPITLGDLHHIDHQKQELERNTRQFLSGLPANNALLWGPRGTGKSSLIKALLNVYADEGLRIIEVERQDLTDLPDIVERLEGKHGKFIVFCDDLSFDEHDHSYRALKVVLDGSIESTPDNVIIYATSNRRHLVPERLRDNLDTQNVDGEIHHSEAVEEKISLSERFGLWLSFHPFNQADYLTIAQHWLTELGTDFDDRTRRAALQWAMLHGSRSGRSAYQFAKDWAGRTALTNSPDSKSDHADA